MRTLDLGILAHVDAGKTSLTERLLYAAGVIPEIGSVDQGTTQTDSLALERERGITIRSAVASFAIGDLAVNVIDTPGHPDFIAEVERVLSVLDGAVLVVSAVEGVQSQTPLLMRALQRQRVPTLLFVNKIDRVGASDERVLGAIARRLTPDILPMASPRGLGTREATVTAASAEDVAPRARLLEALAERDDAVLAAYVEDGAMVPYRRLRQLLAEQTARGRLHPVFFGSAITGAGVDMLMAGIAELLPPAGGDPAGPATGRVFKIERTPSGEKVAYVRLYSGTLRVRDHVRYGGGAEATVTALYAFMPGGPEQRSEVRVGEIAKVSGLGGVRIGDAIGDVPPTAAEHRFAQPTLESVVVPQRAGDTGRLRNALAELAEQDPLIDVRQNDVRREIAVSLYGEVQKEVVQATLAREYGVEVSFRETTTIHVERPTGTGDALEVIRAPTKTNIAGESSQHSTNPYAATIGLRIEPAPVGTGIDFRLATDVRSIPLYVYKTIDAFVEHMAGYVREALREGLFGWAVTDCTVTMTDSGYVRTGSTAGDFRKLTPIVVRRALERAGTTVCEPMARVRLDVPVDSASGVLSLLARLGARVEPPEGRADVSTIGVTVASRLVPELQRRLPGLTAGEGVLESRFAGYEPVMGPSPTRRRRR